MRRRAWVFAVTLAASAWASPATGQVLDGFLSPPVGAPTQFSARAVASHRPVAPGGELHVAVEMNIAGEFWVYGPVAGGRLVVAQDLTIKPGKTPLEVGEVLFSPANPHVTKYPDGDVDTHNVYEGKGYAYVPVTVPAGLAPGEYELPLNIQGQLCDPGTCMQLDTTVVAKVEVGGSTVASPEWTGAVREGLSQSRTAAQWRRPPAGQAGPPRAEVFTAPAGVGMTVAGGLALAFLAGLTLNVMPCVLPVIPLRLLALLNQAGESRRRFVTLGLAFAAGIVLFFVGIAVANATLKLALQYTLKWGDLFRHPELVIALVLLLVALAANMFGAFELTVPGKVAQAETGRGHLGAVGMGFLMAVLSTPCSGAVLAAAFGWAQFQPLWVGTLSLLIMGLGMASPHAVLAGFPRIVARLPRAGRWTGLFKQSVGFVMLLIAVWLLGTQLADAYLAWVMAYAVVLAMCLWMWGSWVGYGAPRAARWSVRAAAAAIAVASGWWMLKPAPPPAVSLRPFDQAEIAAARAAGRTVLVKFTAGWCVECKVVDMRVYSKPEVARALKDANVLAVKGDVTRRDLPATKMLYDQLGQPGPPLTVIFPPRDRPPILLTGAFSAADLFEALTAARARP